MANTVSVRHDGAVSHLLQKYKNLVHKHNYQRLDYPIWCKIASGNYNYMKLTYCPESDSIVFNLDKSYEQFYIKIQKLNFGYFLYNEFFKNKEEPKESNMAATDFISSNMSNPTPSSGLTYSTSTSAGSTAYDNYTNTIYPYSNYTVNSSWNTTENMIDKKENKNMINFDFGPITGNSIRVSPYGLAVMNADGKYVSYDITADKIIDVDVFNFNGNKFIYKLPVALSDVSVGDIIVHNKHLVFVKDIDGNKLGVVDPASGEYKQILPTASPFGFDFTTKVVSMLDLMGSDNATADMPFGNMLPFLLMGDNKDIDPIVFLLMSGGQIDMSNPMMMYFLMSNKGGSNDMLPFLLMSKSVGDLTPGQK